MTTEQQPRETYDAIKANLALSYDFLDSSEIFALTTVRMFESDALVAGERENFELVNKLKTAQAAFEELPYYQSAVGKINAYNEKRGQSDK